MSYFRYGADPFASSTIQALSTSTSALTEEAFLLRQFYHTRTAASCQITATLEFFQAHPELLQQSDWQTIATLNLLQPLVLLQALERNPALQQDCDLFLTHLFTMNCHQGIPNEVGLFCLRLRSRINVYLMDSTLERHQQSASNLLDINKTLTALLKRSLDTSLQREIYLTQCPILVRLLQTKADLQHIHLTSYLTAKLLGSPLSILNLTTNPDAFILQEIDMVTMKWILIKHAESVKTIISALLNDHLKLKLSTVKGAPSPQLQYPSVFIMLADDSVEAGQMMATVNLETGQILKNGKEYALLPTPLLASSTFQALAGPTVKMGWVAMEREKSTPTLFEIIQPHLFIKETQSGFHFQQDFPMLNNELSRCQLTSISEWPILHTLLPTTVCDAEHRFWGTTATPKQIIIQDKTTNNILYHLGSSVQNPSHYGITPIHGSGYDKDYQLLSQADVEKSAISQILGDFEDPQFISIETYRGSDLTKPRLLISFARYHLRFAVTSTTPLTIESLSEPHGTLILDPDLKQKDQLKNSLLIRTDKQVVALLPRQYFIDEKNPNPAAFEYTQLCLDRNNQHANFIVRGGKPPAVYCDQSEFITLPIASDGADPILRPKDGASALYLAYTYLASGAPYAALDQLKYWEQQGGLKGTQRELEHLMLFFKGLPAQIYKDEPVDKKIIQNPEFMAVRAFALYLYANRQTQELLPEVDVASARQDAQCFLSDTGSFQAELTSTFDQTLTRYFTGKHNVPISMQLNTQQEATLLRSSSRTSLLGLSYTHQQAQAFVSPNNKNNPSVTVKNGCAYAVTQHIEFQDLGFKKNPKDTVAVLEEIATPTLQKEYQSEKAFKETCTTKDCLTRAIDQLSLALPMNSFFKNFLTYYCIASAPPTEYPTEKEKLNRFLMHKMHILALKGDVQGALYLKALYLLLIDSEIKNAAFLENKTRLSFYSGASPSFYVFNKTHFAKLIGEIVQNTKKTFEIHDARTPEEKTMPLKQLIGDQTSVMLTPPATDLTSFTYSSEHSNASYSEQLALMGLPSLETLAAESGTSFAEQLGNFKALVETQTAREQLSKANAALKLSTESFVDAAALTLKIERELGDQHHDDIQREIEKAAPLFCNPLDDLALHERVTRTAIRVQDKAEQLRLGLFDYISRCTLPTLDNPIHLGTLSKLKPAINDALLINLYLEGSPQRFSEMTGLDGAQTQIAYELIADYLYVSTYHKQLIAIDQAFDALTAIAPDARLERSFAIRSLALKWITPNRLSIHSDPAALTLFQFATGTLLRPEQVMYLQKQLLRTNGQFDNHLCQLIMGFGKTFLLPILAKAKAIGDNLSVIEVPEALFSTNLANFTQASLKIFNQTPHSFCFTRHSNGSSQALADRYDHLTNIQKSRDYLVTTGESVASLNLRFIEVLNQLAHRKQTILGPQSDDAKLTELKAQAHWLGKLVKLFRYKADAIVDEVHAGLNIRKKLIYSIGAEPIAQDEINGVLRLYQFILPIKAYGDLTVEALIQKPAGIPPNEWPTIMGILTKHLLQDKTSPIHRIFSKMTADHQTLLQRYLHPQIPQTDSKSLFAPLLITEQETLFALMLPADQDVLALYKMELSTLLPATLCKQNRRHYGLLLQEAQIMHAPCAVPFIASDTPNIIRTDDDKVTTTHFANPDETLNYTIQAYLLQGLPKMMVIKILSDLREKAKMSAYVIALQLTPPLKREKCSAASSLR